MKIPCFLCLALVLLPGLAGAQSTAAGSSSAVVPAATPAAASIAVLGDVLHPGVFTISDLQKLAPPETVHASLKGETHDWTGIRLSALLTAAGLKVEAEAKHPETRFIVLARGRDGYLAAFSYAELLPEAEKEPVYLAWAVDRQPLSANEGPFRLVAPGEKLVRRVYNLGNLEVYDGAKWKAAALIEQ